MRLPSGGREPYLTEILPHPSVNLVIEPDGSAVHGVTTGRSSRLLEGRGGGIGTKFRPGAFAPFTRVPVAERTNISAPLEEVLGPEAGGLASARSGCCSGTGFTRPRSGSPRASRTSPASDWTSATSTRRTSSRTSRASWAAHPRSTRPTAPEPRRWLREVQVVSAVISVPVWRAKAEAGKDAASVALLKSARASQGAKRPVGAARRRAARRRLAAAKRDRDCGGDH